MQTRFLRVCPVEEAFSHLLLFQPSLLRNPSVIPGGLRSLCHLATNHPPIHNLGGISVLFQTGADIARINLVLTHGDRVVG